MEPPAPIPTLHPRPPSHRRWPQIMSYPPYKKFYEGPPPQRVIVISSQEGDSNIPSAGTFFWIASFILVMNSLLKINR